MPFLRPINLPAPLIAQSVAAVGLGLYVAFTRKPPIIVGEDYTMLAPEYATARTADSISLLGVVIAGLEVTYLVTAYMPLVDNQFVAASVPIRMGLAALMAAICLKNRRTMSRSGLVELLGLAVLDVSAAVWLGRKLGRWDGMVLSAERWF